MKEIEFEMTGWRRLGCLVVSVVALVLWCGVILLIDTIRPLLK